ncbi:peptidoglycan-binding domain-containing protein [Caballeronia sp. GAWG1-5s-s]|uniref:peptidoglycan-binding domain-containing protein n=1 Tax=Caballeronia sp. GAWG1-5s-s TaxID=2921743 RepID=UPI002027EFCE|nr:peptidoglycan-binding domain-containing protein [Caballeronia sp. GAWG1-5s-s]
MNSQSLQQGDSGDDVKELQQALLQHGFNPGAIDGEYGQGTVAAIISFQRSEGFCPTGWQGREHFSHCSLPNRTRYRHRSRA